MKVLEVTDLSVSYGVVKAVQNVSLEVHEGELVVIVGPNGAGKSSLLRAIAGLTKSRGKVIFAERDVSTVRAENRAKSGLTLVPEGRHIFRRMSVLENLQVAHWGIKNDFARATREIFELFPRLEERKHQLAATLSGGELQMLAVSRALLREPKLLILDEPSIGLAPKVVKQLFETVRDVNQSGTSVLLVEQNAKLALGIAQRGYIMETSRLSASREASEMLSDDILQAAYLGKAHRGEGHGLESEG